MSDVPPGTYVMGTEIEGKKVFRQVTVEAGKLTWVVFKTVRGTRSGREHCRRHPEPIGSAQGRLREGSSNETSVRDLCADVNPRDPSLRSG